MTTFRVAKRAFALGSVLLMASSAAPGDELASKIRGGDTEEAGLVAETKGEFSAYADTDAVSVWTPAVEGTLRNSLGGWSLSGSYLVDVVTAASVDIVSTASGKWQEVRHAASLSGTYKPQSFGVTVVGSLSREPDYLSLTAGGSAMLELADKTITPTLGYTYTRDTSGRTDTPFSVYSLELQRHGVNGGVELILDPTTALTIVGDAIFETGRQEKPYRFIPLFSPGLEDQIPVGSSVARVNALRLPGRIAEHDPDTRNRFALSARLAQRVSGATFVLAERLYADDWGLKASTTDVRALMDASRRVFIWTHLRGHAQSGASFYRRVYTATVSGDTLDVPLLRTGDRELGPLLAGTFGGGLRWFVAAEPRVDEWSVILQTEVTTTNFRDALFVQNRLAFFSAVQVEAQF